MTEGALYIFTLFSDEWEFSSYNVVNTALSFQRYDPDGN
jgi:hypothetical protein